MGLWAHGFMSSWVHGLRGSWVQGLMGSWVQGFPGITHAHIFPFPGLLGAVAVFTHVHSSYVMGFWAFLGKGDEKRGDTKKPLKGVSGAWVLD